METQGSDSYFAWHLSLEGVGQHHVFISWFSICGKDSLVLRYLFPSRSIQFMDARDLLGKPLAICWLI